MSEANMDRAAVSEWMRRIEAENAAQEKYAKKQYTVSKIRAAFSAGSFLVIVVCALIIVPKLLYTFREVDLSMENMHTVMENLEAISSELAEADLAGMLENVNGLVEDSQKGIAEAMEKIAALNIEELNGAIKDLHTVIEPLARLFGK